MFKKYFEHIVKKELQFGSKEAIYPSDIGLQLKNTNYTDLTTLNFANAYRLNIVDVEDALSKVIWSDGLYRKKLYI